METKKIKKNYNIKVEEDLRKRFIAVCKENDTSGSMEIRKFIKEYLKNNSQTKMFI